MNKRSDSKIRAFTDLKVWQAGHRLVIVIYKITKNFPKEETYSLVDQMRRAASSVTSNIAEGFGRRSYKEKLCFYYYAHGSLIELKNQIFIARDVGYLETVSLSELFDLSNQTHKLLQGLITSSRKYLKTSS